MVLYDRENNHKRQGSNSRKERFHSISENFNVVVNRLNGDDILTKLLVRTSPDALTDGVEVTNKERARATSDNIVTVPVNEKSIETKNFIFLGVNNIVPLGGGNSLTYGILVDIACNIDNWVLDGGEIRYLEILSRIDNLLNDTKMKSFGAVTFVGATALKINEELSGMTVVYSIGELN